MELTEVLLDKIVDDEFKMRMNLDDEQFQLLCRSIMRDGVIQPVILRSNKEGFTVIAGHRRTAAAREAGRKTIPALIVDSDDQKAWSIAFTENLFRKDLSPIEESSSIKDCIDSGMYTVETIAKMLNRGVGWVLSRLELINWPGILQEAVHDSVLSVAAARWIAKIDDQAQVELLTMYACENGATERSTQAWYQSYRAANMMVNPVNIEPMEKNRKVDPPEPHSPCVICQQVSPMRELSYLPVCNGCGENLIQIAREKLRS